MKKHKGEEKEVVSELSGNIQGEDGTADERAGRNQRDALSEEVGVSQTSLSKWLRDAAGVEPVAKKVNGKSIKAKVGKRPQDWTAVEKLEAVLESASLSEQELGEYLRRKGLHEAQLEQWRRRVTEASMEALQSKSSRKKASVEAKRVRALERELRRKEKALAETAALLVLKKSGGDLGGRGRLHGVEEREMVLSLVDEAVHSGARLRSVCHEPGLSVKTIQRWRKPGGGEDGRHGPRTVPANKLSVEERQEILETVNSAEWRDLSPNQIVPRLADQEIYLASESTMYRLLREHKQLVHRERSRPAKSRRPNEQEATGPHQLWSWDITYLRGPVRGSFYYLYMIEDVWSRKIVGWQIHEKESPELAASLFKETCAYLKLDPDGLVLHSDNGGPMNGSTMLATLQKLGVVASFSRPHVSDDNPYSEALFRTLKYRPEYPSEAFSSVEHARAWTKTFVIWYNTAHRHSAIRFVTPDERHEGRDKNILAKRHRVYQLARAKTPERWSARLETGRQ